MANVSAPDVGTGGMTWSAEEGRQSCMVFVSRVPGSSREKVRCKKEGRVWRGFFLGGTI